MSDVNLVSNEPEGSNVRKFLAHRGAVVVKETRDIGKLRGNYSDSIVVSTMIIGAVKGTTRNTTYGVKLERSESDRGTSSVLLDFDELEEIKGAFDFIASTAFELSGKQRDYTELTYSTKDNARFGFYQDKQSQRAFAQLESRGDMTFLAIEQLSKLKELLTSAEAHLASRGASEA